MGFGAWPAYVDDVGDKISGTIINAALLNAIRADIEADVFSAANPALSPADIINEVVTARGTLGSLDLRLDVSLNNDGTLITAGLATETQLLSQIGQKNLVKNGNFDTYQYLAADAVPPGRPAAANLPEGWTTVGAPAMQRCGPAEADATNLGTGQYCERITAGGVNATFNQIVIPTAEMTDHVAQLGGRNLQFYVVYQAAGANSIQLEVTDGVATTTSAWLPAAAVPTLTTLTHPVNAAPTALTVTVRVAAGTVVYIGGLGLIVADLPPTAWPYEPGMWYQGGTRRIAGFTSLGHGCPLGAYQDVWTFLGGIPAFALTDNTAIRMFLVGGMANNANQKNLRIYLNTNFVTPINTAAAAGAAAVWTMDAYIMRLTATTAALIGTVTFNAASLAAPTIWHISTAFAGGAHDFATNTPFRIGLFGAAANDITLGHGFVELVKY